MKDKIISIIFVSILCIVSISGLILKDRDISDFERRKLVTRNDLKEDPLNNLDKYLSDQIPFRDGLISFDSFLDRYILQDKEDNGVYLYNGNIIEKNYPLNDTSLDNFIKKLNYVKYNYLINSNVYYAIIPDKSFFLNDDYLKINFEYLYDKLNNELDFSSIDLLAKFKLDDYYKTDIHLKQESYNKIIKDIINKMNLDYKHVEYENRVYKNFYGASYSKVAKFIKPDDISILYNDSISKSKVKHLEYGYKNVYDEYMLDSSDMYNVFLSGPSAVLEIINEECDNDKELIIFRDSFASSLAPLLIPYYKKITLVDLRYIKMDMVSDYVDFKNKDVLFLYSTLIVNNSNILKVDVK